MGADELDWNRTLREQWEFHWNHQLRARLDGLTDDEYFWSPVPDAWSVRPARQLDGAGAGRCRGLHDGLRLPRAGLGGLHHDRLATRSRHRRRARRALRGALRRAGGVVRDLEYADSAATALDQLDVWLAGVRGLGEAGLRVPVGAKEPFPEAPMADLVLHIHRELIHHLSEVCLLRDLYLHTKPATNGATR
jgi:hypothetical protein